MQHKIVFIFLLLTYGTVNAQTSSVTPFSSQGLGEISFYGDAYFTGLGGSSVALIDSSQVNLFNPSSYSFVASGLPLFSMGITHQESEFTQGDLSSRQRFSSITHMALVVPFGKRFGLGFGLKPFSRTGYEINSHEIVNNDSIFYDYSGRGEIQEFLVGFSVKLVNNMNHRLAIGANGKRYFGRIENQRMAYRKINQAMVGAQDQRFLQSGSFGYEFGGTYRFTPSSKHTLTLGGYYRNTQDLSMSNVTTRVHFTDFGNVNSYDTISPYFKDDGSVSLPEKMTFGFAYEFKASRDSASRRGRLPSIMFTGEYTSEPWSEYRENFDNTTQIINYFDSYSLRLGLQYLPHRDILERTSYISFFQKWSYRLGAYQVNLPYIAQNGQVTDRGLSFGIGMPIVMSRTVSMINLSFNYGERGAAGEGVMRENYIGVNFGVNIAPSYDKWFRKYQLD